MDFYSVASSNPFTHGQISWLMSLTIQSLFTREIRYAISNDRKFKKKMQMHI